MLDYHYPLHEAVLPNGLRVIVSEDATSPAVAVNLWYRVGSGDETRATSGFAHLFEHLMFSGTDAIAAGEHLSAIEEVGGHVNATTSADRTNYFEMVPPHAFEFALWLEAQRMENLAVTQFNLDTQREVVKEEKRQRYDNVPYGDELALLLALAYPEEHPYAQPTIGRMETLDTASLDMVQEFYDTWYRPELATLVVCGNVDVDSAFALVEKHFGGISKPPATSPGLHRDGTIEPLAGIPRLNVTRDVPLSDLTLCWRAPAAETPDDLALDIAGAVLGAGQSGRLYRRLVLDTEIAESVSVAPFGFVRGTSLATIGARPRKTSDMERLEEMILEEVAALAEVGPTAAELERVLVNVERELFTELATVDHRADVINRYATLFSDPDLINRDLERVRSVTPDDVAESLRRWMTADKRSVLEYRAANDEVEVETA
ncbi:MAG: insulinase family protein [Propionibacteriaceae bacterium]|nr:insulinase family protein [Propionibacteriaceae bacterium]